MSLAFADRFADNLSQTEGVFLVAVIVGFAFFGFRRAERGSFGLVRSVEFAELLGVGDFISVDVVLGVGHDSFGRVLTVRVFPLQA